MRRARQGLAQRDEEIAFGTQVGPHSGRPRHEPCTCLRPRVPFPGRREGDKQPGGYTPLIAQCVGKIAARNQSAHAVRDDEQCVDPVLALQFGESGVQCA